MRLGLSSGSLFVPVVFFQPGTTFTLPLAEAPDLPTQVR